jgi:hypothetical protein
MCNLSTDIHGMGAWATEEISNQPLVMQVSSAHDYTKNQPTVCTHNEDELSNVPHAIARFTSEGFVEQEPVIAWLGERDRIQT